MATSISMHHYLSTDECPKLIILDFADLERTLLTWKDEIATSGKNTTLTAFHIRQLERHISKLCQMSKQILAYEARIRDWIASI